MFKYFIILTIIARKCDSRCTHEYRNEQCDSLGDVERSGDHPEWTNILIKSFGEQQQITTNTFAKTPKIESITFNNSVNNIEEFSLRNLSSLRELFFVNCDLPVIKKNWFDNLPITKLQLTNSNVDTLEAGCFQGCLSLTAIQLKNNNISRVTANIFANSNIVHLFLDQNQIRFIEERAFANMTKLRILSLKHNLLTGFNPIVMGQKSSLFQLVLDNNQIEYLNKDCFVATPNLTHIYLSSNGLKEIQDGAFNGLIKLKHLDLSLNKLEMFVEKALPYDGLQSLETLFLHDNRLNYLSRSIIRFFPKLKKISIFGNPWQCDCYKDIRNSIYHNNVQIICADEYLNGEKPVCVVPETSGDRHRCAENIPDPTGLYETFIELLDTNTKKSLVQYCFVYSSEIRELIFMNILFDCQFKCRVA